MTTISAASLTAKVPAAVLPEGYRGKIMLILVSAGSERLVILRSGGRWHRDILRNAEAEIAALGLAGIEVREQGGAYAGFEEDGSILLWGRSDQFGRCDLHQAEELLTAAWPGRRVRLEDMP